MFDRLRGWFLFGDRMRDAILVPRADLQEAIEETAKDEGRDTEQYPWESGDEHAKRMRENSANNPITNKQPK